MKIKMRTNVPLPVMGLNTDVPGEWIDKRMLTDVQNMEENRSILRQRPGTLAFDPFGERVMRLVELQQGLIKTLFGVGLTKVKRLNKTNNSWVDVTGTALTGTAADKVSVSFPNLAGQRIMVISNGVDAARKQTGSGDCALLGGSPPKYKFSVAYKSYLFTANITDDGGGNAFGQRVQWPDTDNPESWTPATDSNAGSANLLEDGEDITGVGLYGDYIAVHKESCIYIGYLVDTDEIFRFERRPTGAGAISSETIFELPNGGQIFLARDGIHIFNGAQAPLINSPVMNEIREGMNPAHAFKATAQLVKSKDEYHVAIPMGSQTEPETIYKYNYRTGRVLKDVRPNLTTLGVYERDDEATWDEDTDSWDSATDRWDDTTLEELAKVLVMGFSDGKVTRMDSLLNDNGAAIDAYITTKDFTSQDLKSGAIGQIVEWTEMRTWAKGQAVTLAYSTDGGTTFHDIETMVLSQDYQSDDAPGYSWFHVAASRIRFRYRNNSVSQSFALKQFVPYGMLMEERD